MKAFSFFSNITLPSLIIFLDILWIPISFLFASNTSVTNSNLVFLSIDFSYLFNFSTISGLNPPSTVFPSLLNFKVNLSKSENIFS